MPCPFSDLCMVLAKHVRLSPIAEALSANNTLTLPKLTNLFIYMKKKSTNPKIMMSRYK